MRAFGIEERRNRLARRHGLVDRLGTVCEVAEAMVALHATDPATVYLSSMVRMQEPSLNAVAVALYDERSVVRILGMRRTLFIVPVDYLAVIERSATDAVSANERRRLHKCLTDTGIADPEQWLEALAEEIEQAIDEDGTSARELTGAVPRLATKVVYGLGTRGETTMTATTRALGLLSAEGLLMRGRPAGAWTGRQYQWHLRRHWLPDEDPVATEMTVDDASAELVGRWLRTFGPAPIDDVKWWTGWTARQVKAALQRLDVAEVDLGGVAGLALADDLEPDPPPDPWVALLPALDPTPMGWKEREWYLGPHQAPLFDRSGNIGPTIWADGRIVGGWGQLTDGTVVTRLREDVGADHHAMIDAEAARLTALMDGTAVKPSFPTPLQKELATSG